MLAGLRAPPNWLAGVCTTLLAVRLFDDGVVRLDGDDILQFLQGVQFTRSGCFQGEGGGPRYCSGGFINLIG